MIRGIIRILEFRTVYVHYSCDPASVGVSHQLEIYFWSFRRIVGMRLRVVLPNLLKLEAPNPQNLRSKPRTQIHSMDPTTVHLMKDSEASSWERCGYLALQPKSVWVMDNCG